MLLPAGLAAGQVGPEPGEVGVGVVAGQLQLDVAVQLGEALVAADLRVLGAEQPVEKGGRRAAATHYEEAGLADLVTLPSRTPGAKPAWHLYMVRSERADELLPILKEAGIGSRSYYRTPAHLQPAMRHLGWEPGSLPQTEKAAAENLALPLWGGIGAEVQERVVSTVLDAVGVASAR